MRRASTARLDGHALVIGAGLVAALALRRPELAAVVAPSALLLALGLSARRAGPRAEASLSLADERVVEGEPLPATLHVRAGTPIDRLEVRLLARPGVEAHPQAVAGRFRAGEERTYDVTVRCPRWGLYDLGALELRAHDRFRVLVWQAVHDDTERLQAYPRAETLRRILPPRETQVFTGSEVARARAEGIEYADLREYVPGDRPREINWRASARRAALVVNERHPERNTDVVLFVDSFVDVRRHGRSTLDDTVRATAGLAARYLERRDRVGVVTFGGVLRWVQPALGDAQRYRLVETVLETGVEPTYTWREVDVIPARILPPKALVVGVSPLVDERFVATMADLRGRRFDVAVVEVDPVPLVDPGRSEAERLAYRLWLLHRETIRSRLLSLGIAVARWGGAVSLDAALEGVRAYRRHAWLARG